MKRQKTIALMVVLGLLAGLVVMPVFAVQAVKVLKVEYFVPSADRNPTPENPRPAVVMYDLAAKFERLNPGCKIEWVRPGQMDATQWGQWLTTQIAAGTAPDVGHGYHNNFDNKGWYLPFNDLLERSNPYIKGNKRWADLFPKYLFSTQAVANPKGEVNCMPVTVAAGPPVCIYYNKAAFKKAGITRIPADYQAFVEAVAKLRKAGYTGLTPFDKQVVSWDWRLVFQIAPGMEPVLMPIIDLNQNGIVERAELIKAGYEGVYSGLMHAYAKKVLKLYKDSYGLLEPGWETTDYGPLWNQGKVGMVSDGLWRMPSEFGNTSLKFDFGMFPQPVATKTSGPEFGQVEFRTGPVNPVTADTLSIWKPSVEAHGTKDLAIRFVQFMTAPDNLSAYVIEKGTVLGAVKGTKVPPMLKDWVKQKFPACNYTAWDTGINYNPYQLKISKVCEQWVKGQLSDDEFFKQNDALIFEDALTAAKAAGLDYQSWDQTFAKMNG